LARFPEPEFESRLKTKLKKLELSRTTTLEDPPPKKEPDASRYFLALLQDFQKAPDTYIAREFAKNEKLVALYQLVGERFGNFLAAFDVESISRIVEMPAHDLG
jgi:hypothetical protein